MNTRSLRCGAPTAEAGRLIHVASYPSSAKSPSTRSRPRRRIAATFSTNTSFGRSWRRPAAIVSQSPLLVSYAMCNAGPMASEADVLTWEASTHHVDWIDQAPIDPL